MPRSLSSKIQIRNQTLQKIIDDVDRNRILGISIDPGKDVHEILLFDFNGKLLGKSFKINSLLSGYEKLKKNITKAAKRIKTKKIIIGIEAVHICYENISRHLKEDYQHVFFINPFATASNRKQKLLFGLKTDAIDVASIGDLLIRGECYPYNLREGLYLELKERMHWRDKKILMVTRLKNQIINRLDILYPGLTSKFEDNRPLFVRIFESDIAKLLFDLMLPSHDIANINPIEFSKISCERGYNFKIQKATTIVNYFKKLLHPDKNIVPIYLEMLKTDLMLLRMLEVELGSVEKRMIELTKQTPARILFNQIKGLSDILIASYVGCIGNIKKYSDAGKIYSYSGLAPKISQSGLKIGPKLGIRRSGNKNLRTVLYKMTFNVMINEPYFRDYFKKTKERKSGQESVIATSNKLNRIMFAMIKKQETFKPPAAENFGKLRDQNKIVFVNEASHVSS